MQSLYLLQEALASERKALQNLRKPYEINTYQFKLLATLQNTGLKCIHS